ncbi:hypothetical protein OQA88_1135 [Cercophora sp. LCS_1]
MRLINTHTLAMSEFFDAGIPPYAILSHTWGSDEISFQDWQAISEFDNLEATLDSSEKELFAASWSAAQQRKKVQSLKTKSGFDKILRFCQLAKSRDLEWAWIDTCCIDKTSSAELSEAINSMFGWYARSQHCFVYLLDLPGGISLYGAAWEKAFRESKWFTRG